MKCFICKHGHTHPGEATVTLQRGGNIIVFKQVTAEVGDNCGEDYVSEAVSAQLPARAEAAVKNGAEVEILRFAA